MPGPIIIIPARLAATRLPGKPLADIGGTPMIVHVWRRAMEAALGPGSGRNRQRRRSPRRSDAAGGKALLTRPDHRLGLRPDFRGAAKL